jgi:hypothetical protein
MTARREALALLTATLLPGTRPIARISRLSLSFAVPAELRGNRGEAGHAGIVKRRENPYFTPLQEIAVMRVTQVL